MRDAEKTKEQLRNELEELRKSEEKYRSLIVNIPDVVWTSDENFRIVFLSPNIKDVTGYTAEEECQEMGNFLGWYKRAHPDDVEGAKAAFRALVEGKKHYDIEYRFKRKDGVWIWIHDRSVGTYEKDGEQFADGLISDISVRKEAEKKLRTSQRRLRSMASEMSLAEERERRRLATGLHDQVTQTLAAIEVKLDALREQHLSNGSAAQLDKIRELLDYVIQKTRSLTFDLSPPVLYELGLEAALEWLAEQFQEEHGITCKFESDRTPRSLGDDQRGTLFMAVRELLINVAKHSQARTARVSIRRESNEVHIEVQDNGVGFNSLEVDRRAKGFGLFSVRERLTYLGGRVEIKSAPGNVTRVPLIAPMQDSGQTAGGKLT